MRQQSIQSAFRPRPHVHPEVEETPEELKELESEVERLKLELARKQVEVFEEMRQDLKRTRVTAKLPTNDNKFISQEVMIFEARKKSLQQEMEMYSALTGVEVASYLEDDHCLVLYHMQHSADKPLTHGLRVDMSSGRNEVSKYSLPLGFNIDSVMSQHDNVMHAKCLGDFHRGLMAYYNRQEQYAALAKIVPHEVKLFSAVADNSDIEMSMKINLIGKSSEGHTDLQFRLQYRVYDTRPKLLVFDSNGLAEEGLLELKKQCSVFKKKPLDVAFKECFLSGENLWQCYTYKNNDLSLGTPEACVAQKRKRKQFPYEDDPDYSEPGNSSAEECAQRLVQKYTKNK